MYIRDFTENLKDKHIKKLATDLLALIDQHELNTRP